MQVDQYGRIVRNNSGETRAEASVRQAQRCIEEALRWAKDAKEHGGEVALLQEELQAALAHTPPKV